MIKFSLFLLIFLFASSIVFHNNSESTHSSKVNFILPKTEKTPIYCPADTIDLEKTFVKLHCSDKKNSVSSPDDSVVKVRIHAVHPRQKPLNYKYTVSGGKIIGEGNEVLWNLSEAAIGTHTINVKVFGGKDYKIESTKTLTVAPCESSENLRATIKKPD